MYLGFEEQFMSPALERLYASITIGIDMPISNKIFLLHQWIRNNLSSDASFSQNNDVDTLSSIERYLEHFLKLQISLVKIYYKGKYIK